MYDCAKDINFSNEFFKIKTKSKKKILYIKFNFKKHQKLFG